MIGPKITVRIQHFAALARVFARARRGNVAMLFALSLVPLTLAAGVGLDYARAMLVRQQMSEALDAAALAIGSSTGLDQTAAQVLAQKFFNANYTVDKTAFGTPTVNIPSSGYNSTGSVVLTATDNMPTILVKLVGFNTLPVTASSTVVWGQTKLWVALVLDNSGSMAQGDASGTKMTALKNASHQLLSVLENAATTAGDVKVSIVPFDQHININPSNVSASWIDWTDWEAPSNPIGTNTTYGIANQYSTAPTSISFEAWGPGDHCPFTGATNNNLQSPFGFYCVSGPTNGAGRVSAIPTSGYTGYICPGLDYGSYNTTRRQRYYNGCWTSTKVTSGTTTVTVGTGSDASCDGFLSTNCSCAGNSSNKVCKTQRWTHAWVPNSHSTWGGCIMDRDKTYDYDISNTAPSTTANGFPATNPYDCLGSKVTSLSYDWSSLSTQIDAMAPNASTNQAIGIAHGWQTLSNSTPYSPGAVPSNTSRFIILLSDGLNTQDRWWGNGTEGTTEAGYIDARTASTCTNAKADGIVIYTIFLHIGTSGSSSTLANCASDSTKYFDLTSTTGVVTTFNQIAQQITNVRVSR